MTLPPDIPPCDCGAPRHAIIELDDGNVVTYTCDHCGAFLGETIRPITDDDHENY